MGLFRRGRNIDIDHLRDQVRQLSSRLDHANDEQRALKVELTRAKASTEGVAELQQRVEQVDAVERRLAELAVLEQRVAELGALEQRVGALDDLEHRIDRLDQRAEPHADQFAAGETPPSADDETPAQIPLPTPTPALAVADKAELDKLRDRLDALERRVKAVDERITTTSTELANQISEISNDLDHLDPGDEPDDQQRDAEEAVKALRVSQERLASEQARYQIAFRQDLAELADRLRDRTR